MHQPRVLVLRAAGINCDRETAFAFEQAGAQTETLHVNELMANPARLGDFGLVVVPGGFSYGDDVHAGRVLAIEIAESLGDSFRSFRDRGGLLLGICNGFQVLVKTGLLPGQESARERIAATLTWNDSHRYEDRWVHLRSPTNRCVIVPKELPIIQLPIAHGEGRFTTPSDRELESLKSRGQIVFQYVNSDGTDPHYPENPNGSMGHVAGICDGTGQVLGLMPHPERALFFWHHPDWSRRPRVEGDGAAIFRAAVSAMK